jgi:hypothetical protein
VSECGEAGQTWVDLVLHLDAVENVEMGDGDEEGMSEIDASSKRFSSEQIWEPYAELTYMHSSQDGDQLWFGGRATGRQK